VPKAAYRRSRLVAATSAAAVAGALGLAGCAASPAGGAGEAGGVIHVVAAENFWGSIAGQLGGTHVHVRSLVDNPDADPHDYEPTAADARAVATADVVLVNGVGYDEWASRLASADAVPGRVLLVAGDVVGAKQGDNPHLWYDPADVQKVVEQLVSTYQRLQPSAAADFDRLHQSFETTALSAYDAVVGDIKARYSGTKIGASESIVAMLAPPLGLDLVTPAGFLKAVSEGTDPTAADKTEADQQITDHDIAVYVYNSQNASPDVQRQVEAATAAGIPVTTITETMVPRTATWQQWQSAQLVRLRDALGQAGAA
jgi:zinc/manganese transport system substrate-binding protein